MNIRQDVKQHILAGMLPRPMRVMPCPSDMALRLSSRILIGHAANRQVRFAAQRLATLIEAEFGLSLTVGYDESLPSCVIVIADEVVGAASMLSVLSDREDIADEGFEIQVGASAAVLHASTSRGLLWAAMAFRQLLLRDGEMVIACGARVQDSPRFPFRGFMIDSARAPNSLAKIKRIIRICSTFRLNHLIFREGDDELNAVQYCGNKLGTENPYALTMGEVNELIDYADLHGITLVPEIESLGHSAAKAIHYPHLIEGGYVHDYAGVCSHRRKAYLKPCDDESLSLLESMYDEWLPLLKGNYIHLGIDEVPICSRLREEHLARVLTVVQRVARRHGREITPMVWSDATDVHEGQVLPAVRCIWGYDEHGEVSLDNPYLLEQGIDALLKPGCEQPIILAGGAGSRHVPHAKGVYENTLKNLYDWARIGAACGNCLGLLAVQWAGNMLDDWLPEFLATADWGWNPPAEPVDIKEYTQQTLQQLGRLSDYNTPEPSELDRPAWYGIWLKDRQWHSDILPELQPLKV